MQPKGFRELSRIALQCPQCFKLLRAKACYSDSDLRTVDTVKLQHNRIGFLRGAKTLSRIAKGNQMPCKPNSKQCSQRCANERIAWIAKHFDWQLFESVEVKPSALSQFDFGVARSEALRRACCFGSDSHAHRRLWDVPPQVDNPNF